MDVYRRAFTREVSFPETDGGVRLRVSNRNGLISIRSHDRPVAVVNVIAEVYAESAGDADHEVERLQRAIQVSGNRVEIVTPDLPRPVFTFFDRGPRIDYEILAPHGSALELESRNARIEVRNVRGPVDARSRNGPVHIEDVAESVSVELTNGRATLDRVGGDVRARTTNGPIDLRRLGGSVKASTTNGAVRFEGPIGGDIEMSASNGSIRLAVPPDAQFEIDAESRNGNVRSELPVRGRPATSGPVPRVRLRSGNGSIRLVSI